MIATQFKLTRKDITEIARKNTGIDAYTLHKLIYSLFPGSKRSFLYCDQGGNYLERVILIVSQQEPQRPEHGSMYSKKIPEGFLDYHVYAFQVRMNPVRAQSRKKNRIAVRGREELGQWFLERSKNWGFEVLETNFEVMDMGMEIIEKGNNNTITYNSATFKGVLRVLDSTLFRSAFAEGIGRGRAFGFGLLQLRPLRG